MRNFNQLVHKTVQGETIAEIKATLSDGTPITLSNTGLEGQIAVAQEDGTFRPFPASELELVA